LDLQAFGYKAMLQSIALMKSGRFDTCLHRLVKPLQAEQYKKRKLLETICCAGALCTAPIAAIYQLHFGYELTYLHLAAKLQLCVRLQLFQQELN
jgi:hypothetical protein